MGASEATSPWAAATPRIVSRTSSFVGRPHGRAVRGGDLLLAVPELGAELLERDVLGFERVDERVGVVLGGGHADREKQRLESIGS